MLSCLWVSNFYIDFDFDEENNDEKKDGGGDSSLKNPSGEILYQSPRTTPR